MYTQLLISYAANQQMHIGTIRFNTYYQSATCSGHHHGAATVYQRYMFRQSSWCCYRLPALHTGLKQSPLWHTLLISQVYTHINYMQLANNIITPNFNCFQRYTIWHVTVTWSTWDSHCKSSGFTHAIRQFVYILSVFLHSTLMTSQRRPKCVGD